MALVFFPEITYPLLNKRETFKRRFSGAVRYTFRSTADTCWKKDWLLVPR
jgi:hypothetical protein